MPLTACIVFGFGFLAFCIFLGCVSISKALAMQAIEFQKVATIAEQMLAVALKMLKANEDAKENQTDIPLS